MKERIKALIDNLKHLSGVYLMHDKDDNIIYVGKAKDLQKRVSQYFLRPQVGKVMRMVMEVEYFETVITKNEKEALVLEMNLIHKHYPKYNILLKDGMHYPYIAVRKQGDPYLVIKRNKKDNKFEYFGPYPNSSAAYSTIDLLNKTLPIRKCRTLKSSPCLYYHLGQCLAPCINKIDEKTNDELRKKIRNFVSGNNSEYLKLYKEKMLEASEELRFEQAKEYKEIVDAIEHLNIKQNVETKDKKDRDIFAYARRNGYLSLVVFSYHNGLLLGRNSFVVEEFGETSEQVSELILYYYESHTVPNEIVINDEVVISSLEELIDSKITSYKQGKFLELIISAEENANNALDEYFISEKVDTDKIAVLDELGEMIGVKTPYHIELFDNSHLQGSNAVGAMVAFVNGAPNKKLYRKFKIEHEEKRDDLKSMEEVIFRHYSRSVKENRKLPDLILVDGGLIQIEAALVALAKAGANIPTFGLYKNNRHQTEGLIDKDGNKYEITNKNLFFMLTRMQDEVHRFAISFHREKRSKSMTSSFLDDVKGLGAKRKEIIYRTYKDLDSLKNASVEELEQILPKDVALALYSSLH